jgi:hypothetical protein
MIEACPCCTASLTRSAPHCDSPNCDWLTCSKCRARLCVDDGTYFTQTLWGNDKGYLKAEG